MTGLLLLLKMAKFTWFGRELNDFCDFRQSKNFLAPQKFKNSQVQSQEFSPNFPKPNSSFFMGKTSTTNRRSEFSFVHLKNFPFSSCLHNSIELKCIFFHPLVFPTIHVHELLFLRASHRNTNASMLLKKGSVIFLRECSLWLYKVIIYVFIMLEGPLCVICNLNSFFFTLLSAFLPYLMWGWKSSVMYLNLIYVYLVTFEMLDWCSN